jgi:hypothetical protein
MPDRRHRAPSSCIELAGGEINNDRLSVELIKTADGREMTLIVWPKRPTPVSARKLSETVATCAASSAMP